MTRTIDELSAIIEELEKRIKAISTAHSSLAQIIAVRDSLDAIKVCLNELKDTIIDDTQNQEQLQTVMQNIERIESRITEIESQANNNSSNILSLQNSQNSQDEQISNLTTRISEAENIISAFDEEDVTSLTNRIYEQENNTDDIVYIKDHKINICHLNFGTTPQKTRKYYFRSNSGTEIEQKFKIFFESCTANTITFNLYFNDKIYLTKSFNMQPNQQYIEFDYEFFSTGDYQNFQFEFVADCGNVVIKQIETHFVGANVKVFSYDEELKIRCINKTIFVTKYDGVNIRFGKFAKDDFTVESINLENLPFAITDIDDENKITYACFCGGFTEDGTRQYTFYDRLIIERNDGKVYFYDYNCQTQTITLLSEFNIPAYTVYKLDLRFMPYYLVIGQRYAIYRSFTNGIDYAYNGTNPLTKKVYDIVDISISYLENDKLLNTINHSVCYFLYADGNYYFQYTCNSKKILKLGKYKTVKAFMHNNDVSTAFLFNGKDMRVIKTTTSSTIVEVTTLENCSNAFLLYDNKCLCKINNQYQIIQI